MPPAPSQILSPKRASTADSVIYESPPLDTQRGDIRLIRLLPELFRDGIRIEIFHLQPLLLLFAKRNSERFSHCYKEGATTAKALSKHKC